MLLRGRRVCLEVGGMLRGRRVCLEGGGCA